MNHIKIAIDGKSGTGKSSLAKYLSEVLHITYIDTGAMYRAFALYTKEKGILDDDDTVYESNIRNILVKQAPIIDFDNDGEITLDYHNVSDRIRNEEISMLSSRVSKFKVVRDFLVERQKKLSKTHHNIVMEGRDIASVVMPEADIKFFLTTDVRTRAYRRQEDYIKKAIEKDEENFVTLKEIEENLIKRDEQDSNRENSPLIKVDDAILVDTTDISIDVKNEIVLDTIYERLFNIYPKESRSIDGYVSRSKDRQYEYDKAYIEMAFSMAKLSHAHRMKAGAIIVSKDDQIISQGYNGTPSRFSNCCEEFDVNGKLKTKDIVLHAEANAITKCAKSNISSIGSTIYITASPCINCAKMIIQAGITKVIYCNDYRSNDGVELLVKSGITVKKIIMEPEENGERYIDKN